MPCVRNRNDGGFCVWRNGRTLVLVIDDDAGVRGLLHALLRHRGLQHESAADGRTAIDKLRRGTYAAVLLDLMLPGENGFEVLRFLRAERPTQLPRVVVMTACSKATLRHFDASGLHGVIRKPFDIAEMMDAVDACVGQNSEP
jgi:CheY-like chemotaxis protein